MILNTKNYSKTPFKVIRKEYLFTFFVALSLFVADQMKAQSTDSMEKFAAGTDKELIVYTDVPNNHPEKENRSELSLAASPYYTIEVKSEATGDDWVNVFLHCTKNKADQSPDGKGKAATNYAYHNHTKSWTHSYGNIEMANKQPVEVRVTLKQAIKGNTIAIKSAVHPFQKVFNSRIENGQVLFTIYNPAQIVIDINGQMDDVNKAVNGNAGDIVHAVSLFANPIMDDKPAPSGGAGVVYVQPGQTPPAIGNNTTMYFNPGVHFIDVNFKVHPNKHYYIPGNAIVYGTMNNVGVSIPNDGTAISSGHGIKIFGYGTLSGSIFDHWEFQDDVTNGTISNSVYKGILIENAYQTILKGITVDDTANHSVALDNWNGRLDKTVPVSFATWAKVITWRANGDGIVADDIQDSFLRTSDDCSYMKGHRKRLTFWKDSNAAIFHMAMIPEYNGAAPKSFPIEIEDCDVIYNRSRNLQGEGNTGVFHLRGTGGNNMDLGSRTVNVLVKNIRLHDKRSNMPTFNMFTYLSSNAFIQPYKGLTFENIWVAANVNPAAYQTYARLEGNPAAAWDSSLAFNNVYDRGSIVSGLGNFTVTSNAQPSFLTKKLSVNVSAGDNGTVTTPSANKVFNTMHTVVATPNTGYDFLYWTEGDVVVSLTASYTFNVISERNLKANFKINDIPVSSIAITSCPVDLWVDAKRRLSATVLPANATDKTVTWTSDNGLIATVTNSGLLIGRSTGQVTIKATSSNGLVHSLIVTIKAKGTQTAYLGTVRTIPTDIIEGEHYDEGGQGKGYNDDLTKQGFLTFRPNDKVDVVAKSSASNGLVVGFSKDKEWLDYTVNAAPGTYNLTFKYFCFTTGVGQLRVSLDGVVLTTITNIVNQGSQTQQGSITIPNISIAEGIGNRLRLEFVNGEKFDIDSIQFHTTSSSSRVAATLNRVENDVKTGIVLYPNPVQYLLNINFPHSDTSREIQIVNMLGQMVYSTTTQNDQLTIDMKALSLKGVVLVKIISNEGTSTQKIVVE
jgi:Bacterial Ig-like domain (group 2)/Divergent InlB B-repeat domain/Secretion system C-terminal sorting domain